MKYTTCLIGVAVLTSTLAVGCKPSGEKTPDPETETTQQQMSRAETAVGDASQDLEAYTFAQKKQFIASMEAELEAINRSIDELAMRIEKSGADAKASAAPRLDELRHDADLLEANLDEVKNATASTWDSVKSTTRETYDNLKQNFNDARQWMSDNIEP